MRSVPECVRWTSVLSLAGEQGQASLEREAVEGDRFPTELYQVTQLSGIQQDAAQYASRNGDAGYGNGQYTQVVPGSFTNQDVCGENGWWGEQRGAARCAVGRGRLSAERLPGAVI